MVTSRMYLGGDQKGRCLSKEVIMFMTVTLMVSSGELYNDNVRGNIRDCGPVWAQQEVFCCPRFTYKEPQNSCTVRLRLDWAGRLDWKASSLEDWKGKGG